MEKKIRIGLNGFGRIGRGILHFIDENNLNIQVVFINDTNASSTNLAYLYNFDSLRGRAQSRLVCESKKNFKFKEKNISFFSCKKLKEIGLKKDAVDIIVDCTWAFENLNDASSLIKEKVCKKYICTGMLEKKKYPNFIYGLNHENYKSDRDHVFSTSTCDANALAPVIHFLEHKYGIQTGFLTTLHPWLSHQNLMDGPSPAQSKKVTPDVLESNFALGRSSTASLIPKRTSSIKAVSMVLPGIEKKFSCLSFRVPTAIVTCADLSFLTKKKLSHNQLVRDLITWQKKHSTVALNFEPLVSIDFSKTTSSCIVDMRWLHVHKGRSIKMAVWYDNEWAYCASVCRFINYIFSDFKTEEPATYT